MYFFTGLSPRWNYAPWIQPGTHLMYSAAAFWTGDGWRRERFPKQAGMRWLDSGGYLLLNRYGRYPFSADNLANLVSHLQPDYYASKDYPCEPNISRGMAGLMTNEERIRATVLAAVEQAELETLVGSRPQLVPVIQGYTLDEYVFCLDLYREAGLLRPYMAVGSMCRRASSSELERLLPALHDYAKSLGVYWLHLFGLRLSRQVRAVSAYIWSQDSAAVFFAADRKTREEWGGRFPKTVMQKQAAFVFFWARVADSELLYRDGQPGACPSCHHFDIVPPIDEFPTWGCANCGHEWED